MVAATAVTVAAMGTAPNVIPAGDLQTVLGSIYGKAVYAADQVGAATYKADQANSRLDTLEGTAADASTTAYAAKGTADYAASQVGFLDYHLRQIAVLVDYTVPPAPTA